MSFQNISLNMKICLWINVLFNFPKTIDVSVALLGLRKPFQGTLCSIRKCNELLKLPLKHTKRYSEFVSWLNPKSWKINYTGCFLFSTSLTGRFFPQNYPIFKSPGIFHIFIKCATWWWFEIWCICYFDMKIVSNRNHFFITAA